jgi:hypothetical protein
LNAEVAQGSKYFAYLGGILALFDLGDPGLRGADRARQFGLGQAAMTACCRNDLADFHGGLCPHVMVLWSIEYN